MNQQKPSNLRNPRRLLRTVGVFAAAALPFIAFFWNRRSFAIGALFVRWELQRSFVLAMVLSSVLVVSVIGALLFLARLGAGRAFAVRFMVGDSPLWLRLGLVMLLLSSLVIGVDLVRMRYRIFSETAYQRVALQAIADQRPTHARFICERYLQLYPQRRSGGLMKDRVCVDLLQFMDEAAVTRDFISAYEPEVGNDGVNTLPVLWGTRRRAIEFLDEWSGGLRRGDVTD